MNEFAAVTHPGAREGENQDVIGWDVEHQFWFVADGMGGYSRGQDASRLVKETLLAQIGHMDLLAAVLKAHEVVRETAEQGEGDHRMGSTVVCAQISRHDCRIVWVGDSRAYLWRQGALQRLTRDHSFVEALSETEPLSETQMRTHPNASEVHHGDWIMLCSDGVPVELRDSEIAHILQRSASPQQAAQQLVDGALKKGGRDNTSVVVVQHEGAPSKGLMASLTRVDTAVIGWIAALAGVVLAAAVVIVAWRLHAGR